MEVSYEMRKNDSVPLSEVVTSEFASLLVIAWASSFWIIGFGGSLRGSGLRNMGYM